MRIASAFPTAGKHAGNSGGVLLPCYTGSVTPSDCFGGGVQALTSVGASLSLV